MRVYGLERYCIGAAADPAQGGTVLLGYAGLSEEEIAEAAAILKKCAHRLANHRIVIDDADPDRLGL